MSTLPVRNAININDDMGRFALNYIRQVMALPKAKVDRKSFLNSQLRSYCPAEQVQAAIAVNPAHAGIPIAKIDRIADSVIRSQVKKAGVLSFASGIPGGVFRLVTIFGDELQSNVNAVCLAQKLMYLYGWSDINILDEFDEETKLQVLMLLGSMLGVRELNNALNFGSKRFAQQVEKRVAKQALTKTPYYLPFKKLLKWFGVGLTKQSYARGLSKFIPVFGGFLSAGTTTWTLNSRAQELKNHLRGLEFAQPSAPKQHIIIDA